MTERAAGKQCTISRTYPPLVARSTKHAISLLLESMQ